MDFSFKQVVDLVSGFGIPGIMLIIWYYSEKSHEKTIRHYRDDMHKILQQYHEEMIEQRRMYDNNVELVKECLDNSRDLKDVVLLNTQAWQKASDDINRNQFCPQVRLRKEAEGRQIG